MSPTVTETKTRTSATAAKPRRKIAVLGCGKLGTILLQAFLERGLVTREDAIATIQHEDRCKSLSAALGGVSCTTDNRRAVAASSIVILGVKPQTMEQLLKEIAPAIQPGTLVISVVTSATLRFIQERLGPEAAVIRAMPNTPAMVGAGMTALAGGLAVKPDQLETAKVLFESVGRVAVVDEKHMDAITALSASGPAFVFVILESLAEAGVKCGLPRDLATTLAAQTLFGAAQLALKTGHHPALLKDAVTTPAGCTIDGLIELEQGGLRVTLINAVIKTAARARELMTS
ncbi:MAG TPA: pyrroline-5-carboxylate reductase [Candidatus Saccharimonadales bacterium]|jgi:pyrroline-5-carboxylate reductase|nr:pyrroline-5-carboxylate reductase [Candidatus Saccharimonadales bacterium]